ncbi:MAG: hypothetical protein AB8B79_02280 [Granulosicoccus sp.]
MNSAGRSLLTTQLLRMSRIALAIVCTIVNSFTFAQTADTVAPIIELEELQEAIADRSQVFTVQIAEDVQLRDATLYYRRTGQLPYTPAPMQALGNSGFYSVSVPTDSSDLRTIEYYVQARDEAGNRTVSGFAFDPYMRSLLAPTTSEAEPKTAAVQNSSVPDRQQQNTPSFFQRRWVQVTLGVIAAGVVVSLVDEDGEDSQVVPIQFNLQ